MSEYVADTHALLWHFHSPERLGTAAREAMAEVDEGASLAWIPAVVMAEAIMVAERRRIAGLTVKTSSHSSSSSETRRTTGFRP